MAGNKSRDKGNRLEREAAATMGAKKVSRMYKPGSDLLWRGRDVEVKSRKDGFKTLYRWLDNAQVVMMRADRQEWLVTMRYDDLADLLEETADGTDSV